MIVKQLETWNEIFDYIVRQNIPVYILYPEGENMIMANNREYIEVSNAFNDRVPFVVFLED